MRVDTKSASGGGRIEARMTGIGGAGRCAMTAGGKTGDRQREDAGHDPGQAEAAARATRRPARRSRPASPFRDPLELAAEVARRSASGPRDPSRDTSCTTRSSAGGVIGWTVEIGGGSVLHDRRDQRGLARARERLPARRHLVEHGAEREDVRPRVGLLALELLRRHVLEGPEDRAFLRQALLRRQRRQARLVGVAGAIAFASPKSSSFTPDFVSITLPGFRSRCTIPCRCALSSASAISTP